MIIRNFPNYSISEDGTIISLKTKKEMKVKKGKVTLTQNKVRTTFKIMDLVLEHFGISSFKTYVGINCEFIFALFGTEMFCICEDQKVINLQTMEVFINEEEFTNSTGYKFDIDYSIEFPFASWDENIIPLEEFPGYAITKDKKLYNLKTNKEHKGNCLRTGGISHFLRIDYLYNKYFK